MRDADRSAADATRVLVRGLAILEAVITRDGEASLAAVARTVALPLPTVHRHAQILAEQGYLTRIARGRYLPGPRLRALSGRIDDLSILTRVAAVVLQPLAATVKRIVQFGTLDDSMVTYRLKLGRGGRHLFTQTDMQLEAYCSAIGKAMLAQLGPRELDAYLASGPFVPLTERTIVDPDLLRAELLTVRTQGFARDTGEVAPGLNCLAVPFLGAPDDTIAAISVSWMDGAAISQADEANLLRRLRHASQQISRIFRGTNRAQDRRLPAD
jgi:DNA-binding IclR family transcriptional regulator